MSGMTPARGLTNKETAEAIRKWCAEPRSHWSWPTDGCGYDQHVRFVMHRNRNWNGGTLEEYRAFALAYADELEQIADAAAEAL